MRLGKALLVAAVVAVIGVLALAVPGLRGASLGVRANQGERPSAPTFALPLLSGSGNVSSSDLRGRPVVVNFWASWCDPCKDEAPLLEDAARAYGERAAFVGINRGEVIGAAQRFARDYHLSFTLVRDGDRTVERAFGVAGVPETFVLDADGRVIRFFPGPIASLDDLDEALRAAGA